MRQVWHRPCCEKTTNEVEINHIVLAVQIAHIQTLPANVASLNRMTVSDNQQPNRTTSTLLWHAISIVWRNMRGMAITSIIITVLGFTLYRSQNPLPNPNESVMAIIVPAAAYIGGGIFTCIFASIFLLGVIVPFCRLKRHEQSQEPSATPLSKPPQAETSKTRSNEPVDH